MPTSDNFIENIDITNYKIFKTFNAEGFKRVNLIGGYNNIGKTAFLEACYLNLQAGTVKNFISSLTSIEYMRQNINMLTKCAIQRGLHHKDLVELFEHTHGFTIKTNIRKSSYNISDVDGVKKYILTIDDSDKEILSHELNIENSKLSMIKFIDNFGASDVELQDMYKSIQLLEKEDELDKYINEFDDQVVSFKFIGNVPKCKLKNDDEFYSLTSSFGDGLKSYISIICALYSAKNGVLFIDEIDNGIHYCHFNNIWRIIFKISKAVNCQVFAVSHSHEMIESFNRIQNEIQDKDTIYFELARDKKNNTIIMSDIQQNQLNYELTHQGRFRGE